METRPLLPINQLTSTFVSAIVCIRLGCTPHFGMHIQTGLFSVSFGMHVHSVLHTHTDEFAHQGIRLARSRIRTGELFDLSIVCIYHQSSYTASVLHTRGKSGLFSVSFPHTLGCTYRQMWVLPTMNYTGWATGPQTRKDCSMFMQWKVEDVFCFLYRADLEHKGPCQILLMIK